MHLNNIELGFRHVQYDIDIFIILLYKRQVPHDIYPFRKGGLSQIGSV